MTDILGIKKSIRGQIPKFQLRTEGICPHIYTAVAFQLGKDQREVEAIAEEIVAKHPHWQATGGFVNIFLTEEELLCCINGLARKFRPDSIPESYLDEGEPGFLSHYGIYLARNCEEALQELTFLPPSLKELGVLLVYGSLGGSVQKVEEGFYRALRKEGRLPVAVLFAAAEIFADNLYKPQK